MLVGGACAVAPSSGNVGDAGCALWLGMAAVDPLNGLNVLLAIAGGAFQKHFESRIRRDTVDTEKSKKRRRSCNPNSLITKSRCALAP